MAERSTAFWSGMSGDTPLLGAHLFARNLPRHNTLHLTVGNAKMPALTTMIWDDSRIRIKRLIRYGDHPFLKEKKKESIRIARVHERKMPMIFPFPVYLHAFPG
jgi:hypothetical protein